MWLWRAVQWPTGRTVVWCTQQTTPQGKWLFMNLVVRIRIISLPFDTFPSVLTVEKRRWSNGLAALCCLLKDFKVGVWKKPVSFKPSLAAPFFTTKTNPVLEITARWLSWQALPSACCGPTLRSSGLLSRQTPCYRGFQNHWTPDSPPGHSQLFWEGIWFFSVYLQV